MQLVKNNQQISNNKVIFDIIIKKKKTKTLFMLYSIADKINYLTLLILRCTIVALQWRVVNDEKGMKRQSSTSKSKK